MSEEHRHKGVESSIRTAAMWHVVQAWTAEAEQRLGRELRILDLGGGSGGFAVPLAAQGHEVVVVDPSPDALASLDRRSAEAGVRDQVRGFQGDALTVAQAATEPVDLVCCHGVLEYVDDTQPALQAIHDVLAPQGALSLLVAQRLAAVLSRALAGHFTAARTALESSDGRWGKADPLPRRFDVDALHTELAAAGLRPTDTRGVRLFSDLVPSAFLESDADRAALLALEEAVAGHPASAAFGPLASAVHVLAVRED